MRVVDAILMHGQSDDHKFNFANLWILDDNLSREWKTEWGSQKCYEVN